MNASCEKADSFSESEATESFNARTLHDDGERFRLLVENSQDVIVEISGDFEVLYVSPNAAAVLGYTPTELIGTDILAKVHPEDLGDVRSHLDRATGSATCRYRHKDGSWRWFETTGREFVTPDGAANRVLVARDITARIQAEAERERLEAELVKAEKLTALGALAGGMAHDFNNILTAIIAHAGLAQLRTCEPAVRDSIEQILKAADRAKQITQHVLEFSSQQKGSRAPVKLAVVAQEVLKLLRLTIPPHVEVFADLSDEAGIVFANATQLHQILVNLCQNAIHAMPQRYGRLILRVERLMVDETLARQHAGLRCGAHVCLLVVDNGHGMDSATQRRIFEPFFTTKSEGRGTGLGLVVVQRIVRDHGGVIHVASQPGEGTAFRIFFPAHREGATLEPRSGSSATAAAPRSAPASSHRS